MLMNKSVQNAIRLIKARGNQIEILRIGRIIAAEYRVGDVIRNLYQA